MMVQFSLIIGIDLYKSDAIQNLRGAVSDAQAVATFLHQRGIPQDHITVLENKAATRLAILGEFQRLANDPRIRHEDSIVIFYAGHSSQTAAPPNKEPGSPNANVQLMLSYDSYYGSGDQMVPPIPDRTLGALVEAISQKKGDNIVFIRDTCFAASHIARGFGVPDEMIRFTRPPFDFMLPENLDKEICTFTPDHLTLRSCVLLSASSSSGEAWESNGRGVFTVALLDLLEDCQIDKLRYCDIPMRLDIDCGQHPHVEGLNRERYVFTTTSSSTQYFIPVYTRISKNGPLGYILNGGTAHGLNVGDEFAIYNDMDYPISGGILVVDEVGPFYSVMGSPLDGGIPLGGYSVAIRIKEGRRQSLRVYSPLVDKAFDMLSFIRDQDSGQSLSSFSIVDTPAECDIDLSMQDDQAVVRLVDMGSTHRYYIGLNISQLARVLKASSQFLYEFNRTADFPAITQHIEIDFLESLVSQRKFPDVPATAQRTFPCDSGPLELQQGFVYGIKMTNNSPYNLYPIVQLFSPTNNFEIDTLYQPGYRTKSDEPFPKNGGTLIVGYRTCKETSPVDDSPSSAGNGLTFLKISLLSRPVDPSYDTYSFRWARYLSEDFKGPWATIVKEVPYYRSEKQTSLFDDQQDTQDC